MHTVNKSVSIFISVIFVFLTAFGVPQSTRAAGPLCVDPTNTSTCFATIQEAVDAAVSGDVINVVAGTYNENVIINTNNISLIGALAMNIPAIVSNHPRGVPRDDRDRLDALAGLRTGLTHGGSPRVGLRARAARVSVPRRQPPPERER